MKTVWIIITSVVLVALALGLLYRKYSGGQLETYPYQVIKAYDAFEIRTYEATLFTRVTIAPDDFKGSSSKGFRLLAGYIFGGNDRQEKIAMTTPVAMSLEDSVTMMFMVPKAFDKNTLPTPNDPSIGFVTEPQKTVAAIRFGGWANDSIIAVHKQQLINALAQQGISHQKNFYFFGYNAPFELINRRNELIVELNTKQQAH